MARAEAEPLRVVERLDRREHPVEVEQRLAHAHEHDVGQALAVGGEAARGVPRPGRRSRPSRGRARSPSSPVAQNGHPTAHPAWLEMHSVCRSRERAARRVVHQHRLDERAVVESMERLLGLPAVARPAARSRGPCRGGSRGERVPQRGAGACGSSAARSTPPSFQMASAIWRPRNDWLALRRHPGGEFSASAPRAPVGRRASAGSARCHGVEASAARSAPGQTGVPPRPCPRSVLAGLARPGQLRPLQGSSAVDGREARLVPVATTWPGTSPGSESPPPRGRSIARGRRRRSCPATTRGRAPDVRAPRRAGRGPAARPRAGGAG